jgi:hypothetical protein
MPPVGPELPPHLAKRKRSISDSNHPSSPPQKILAATAPAPRTLGPTLPPSKNPDALVLDDSSEDDYGPSVILPQSGSSLPQRVAGPTAAPKNPDALALDDSSEDEYAPAAKPTTQPPRRVLGPALPPASLSEMPSHPAIDSSSDSDDYGPSLPPPPGSAAEASLLRQRAEEVSLASEPQEPAKARRDDWMLVPPSDSDWSSRVDPTKLKNRKFASGKGAKAPAEKSGISAIWTETPEEKRRRLADQVLGRVDAQGAGGNGGRKETEEERRTARRIQEYNEKNRGKTLMEEHSGRKGGPEKEDDPSQRGFDREKDMALGGRLGHGQKKELLAKAADFGSRFQKGKYL